MSGPVQVREQDGARVVAVTGELDVLTAPEVSAQLPGIAHGATRVVLDLSALDFFDSAGVRLVDDLARACAATGAEWRVVSPPGSVSHRVLELVGMLGPRVVPDVAAATR